MESFLKRNRNKTRLLAKAQEYVSTYFDDFALIQMVDWKADALRQKDNFGKIEIIDGVITGLELLPEGENPDLQLILPYIEAVKVWKDQVMADYLMYRKPKALTGDEVSYDYSNHGQPPVSFTDLFLIVNADQRPNGWQMPEI